MSSEMTKLNDMDLPLSIKKTEEFREILLECIEEVLSFSQVVLNFLEMSTPFKRVNILECSDVFSNELEDLFGDSARGIEDLILERLYKKINKKYEKNRDKKFDEYIRDALKGYIEYY
jgi:hypothetical protein